ncbi:hypothetical protein D9M68_101380 [compost metagenome]
MQRKFAAHGGESSKRTKHAVRPGYRALSPRPSTPASRDPPVPLASRSRLRPQAGVFATAVAGHLRTSPGRSARKFERQFHPENRRPRVDRGGRVVGRTLASYRAPKTMPEQPKSAMENGGENRHSCGLVQSRSRRLRLATLHRRCSAPLCLQATFVALRSRSQFAWDRCLTA